ncbi:MAG TPA: HPr family phosphocarrier protein [Desulfobacterales bacterium]|nr:HPr family phosphocarrier protein [Desulfobacterales bacterium]
MTERIVTIRNRAGMHARPAALLVKTASAFAAQVYIEKDGERVNGKSIMGVITLGATYNSQLKVIADGLDEVAALDAMERLFENRFEEE